MALQRMLKSANGVCSTALPLKQTVICWLIRTLFFPLLEKICKYAGCMSPPLPLMDHMDMEERLHRLTRLLPSPLVTITRGDGSTVAFYNGQPMQQPSASMTTMTPHTPATPGVTSTLLLIGSMYYEQALDGKVTAFKQRPNNMPSSMLYIRDSVGNTKTLTYSAGQLSSLQDPAGRLVILSYNSSNLLQNIDDWAGRRTTFAYDTTSAAPKNLLTAVTGPTGSVFEYQFTTFALSTSVAPAGYDWLMSGIEDPNGYGTSYTVRASTVPGHTGRQVGVHSHTI